jgi:hypothetical protein
VSSHAGKLAGQNTVRAASSDAGFTHNYIAAIAAPDDWMFGGTC